MQNMISLRYFKIVKARDGGSYKLEYYEHQAHSKNSNKAKGFVQVNPNSEILRCDVDGKENGFKLTLTTGAKYSRTNDFFLQAQGEGDMLTWIDALKEHAETKISDADMETARYRFPHNTPDTKEAYFYRSIFDEHFPLASASACVPGGPSVACSSPEALAWDPELSAVTDPSGRAVLGVHRESY